MNWLDEMTKRVREIGVTDCPDCGVKPGQPHEEGCDVEHCSACGWQLLSCFCNGKHDPLFARWTGFWPGVLESIALGIDLNELHERGLGKLLFVKPKRG